MKITQNAYKKIINTFLIPPPEQGGIIGLKNDVVCEYFHDDFCAITDKAMYTPNVAILNQKIEEWHERGVEFAGIIHSHMSGQPSLSSGDKEYIETVFMELPENINKLYFPIIIPATKQVISFVAIRQNKDVIIQQDEIHIIL